MNVFVYYAHDNEGRMLAALVKYCDAVSRFQFLPLESNHSVVRMRKFLERQNLDPGSGFCFFGTKELCAENVTPPFVVLVKNDQRSVLYGEGFQRWCLNLIQALGASDDTTPQRIMNAIIQPNCSRSTVALFQYALCPQPTADVEVVPVEVTPPVATRSRAPSAATPPVPRVAQRIRETAPEVVPDVSEEDNTDLEESSVPSHTTSRKDHVNITDIMHESRKREAMNQRNNLR